MTDSSIAFGSVFGVIIVQEERKYKDVFFCFYLFPRVRGGATRLKVAGWIPEGVIGIVHWFNPWGRISL